MFRGEAVFYGDDPITLGNNPAQTVLNSGGQVDLILHAELSLHRDTSCGCRSLCEHNSDCFATHNDQSGVKKWRYTLAGDQTKGTVRPEIRVIPKDDRSGEKVHLDFSFMHNFSRFRQRKIPLTRNFQNPRRKNKLSQVFEKQNFKTYSQIKAPR